jgi:folate-binding protein YgfZ
MTNIAFLPDRGVIAIDGADRVAFLQGLVSNDVTAARQGHAVWAALLTPQGKWLTDFFILSDGDRLLLDCERDQIAALLTRLSRYRLRMAVTLRAEPGLEVFVGWHGRPDVEGIVAPDPRLPDFAWRVLSAAKGATIGVAANAVATTRVATNATAEEWDLYRLRAGLPDGSRDMEADRSVLLEAGFDELGGVSWTKGCYMGQELTARTKYRGLVKRRLVPVAVEGPLPPPGSPILRDGTEVGAMRSGRDQIGLASLRLDAIGATLRCADATLVASVPGWMRLAERTGTLEHFHPDCAG